jgi:hypothetical protein
MTPRSSAKEKKRRITVTVLLCVQGESGWPVWVFVVRRRFARYARRCASRTVGARWTPRAFRCSMSLPTSSAAFSMDAAE